MTAGNNRDSRRNFAGGIKRNAIIKQLSTVFVERFSSATVKTIRLVFERWRYGKHYIVFG